MSSVTSLTLLLIWVFVMAYIMGNTVRMYALGEAELEKQRKLRGGFKPLNPPNQYPLDLYDKYLTRRIYEAAEQKGISYEDFDKTEDLQKSLEALEDSEEK